MHWLYPNGIFTHTDNVSVPGDLNHEFRGQTAYNPTSGYMSIANKLLVNQRVWHVDSPQDWCAFRSKMVVRNHSNNYAWANMVDYLPDPNDPLIIYYATYHNGVVKQTNGVKTITKGYTSPNYGQWANPVTSSFYFNGRGATTISCQVY